MNENVMQQLKDATWDLHENAENHTFQKSMAGGSLSRNGYVAHLVQMLFVHRALEERMQELNNSDRFATVIHDYHFRADLVEQDLRYFDVDPSSVQPNEATRQLIARLESLMNQGDAAVLGIHYVLEGSTNGSKFIAKSIRQSLKIDGDAGASYLDPHGEEQRTRWKAFKTDMDAVGMNEDECRLATEAARTMFEGTISIGESLMLIESGAGGSSAGGTV